MIEDQIVNLKKYTNCFEEFGKVTSKRGPGFTPSYNYFAKILELSYNLSHFVPIFKKIDLKLGQV